MPTKRTFKFGTMRSGVVLFTAAASCSFVGFQGVDIADECYFGKLRSQAV